MPTLPDERQTAILDRLLRDGRVLAADLASEFDTSEDTIRRDLRDLAAAGQCRRVYGGALPLAPASQPLARRIASAPDSKRALGRAAAMLVKNRDTVMIDSGSTNLQIAEALPVDLDITVVTNAPSVAQALAGRRSCTVVMLGGKIDPILGAAFGPLTLRDLDGIRPDIAFIGACGLAAAAGLTVFDPEEAEFKRRLVANSARNVVALTADKLGTAASFVVAPIAALHDLIVEADASPAALADLARPGLTLHRAPAPRGSR
ncbi:MAG: DeoR/GlpR family DNA-binding transcription regulator [Janthinobacterium lividum]